MLQNKAFKQENVADINLARYRTAAFVNSKDVNTFKDSIKQALGLSTTVTTQGFLFTRKADESSFITTLYSTSLLVFITENSEPQNGVFY